MPQPHRQPRQCKFITTSIHRPRPMDACRATPRGYPSKNPSSRSTPVGAAHHSSHCLRRGGRRRGSACHPALPQHKRTAGSPAAPGGVDPGGAGDLLLRPAAGGARPGQLYFTAVARCERAWNKSPPDVVGDEEWRGEGYRSMDCGEDSFMFTPFVLGVADGVGGWRLQGIDPGIFANKLMQEAKAYALDGTCTDPVKLMQMAYMMTIQSVEYGSSTCCIASLSLEGTLSVANLGDSGLLVLRDGEVIHRTEPQQVGFNFPLQLSTHYSSESPPHLPANSAQSQLQVKPGDLVVLATDGLLDNLFEADIAGIISRGLSANQSLTQIAIAAKAEANKRSRDRSYVSPFAVAANNAGIPLAGGKADDITMVIARVEAQE
eukprot:TRINITY_DN3704_c0_g2_i2.p1 TRINITY_DN3704_c0_g2~~TRINITY_DN3704_c0_g2_i2.p1  ORF type:complete len:377 (+),score=59.83 TRINITY_DN3704_c0_g2_i2:413-1543(+)